MSDGFATCRSEGEHTFTVNCYPQILLGVVLCNFLLLIGLDLYLVLPSCLELFVLSILRGGDHCVLEVKSFSQTAARRERTMWWCSTQDFVELFEKEEG
jgi:hypothetical protein